MKLLDTPLEGLLVVETDPVADTRGRFVRIFCEQALAAIRPSLHFTQINLSTTHQRGTVRGLHYQQAPMAEAKLIRCIAGSVFDVAVDLRRDSPTFLRWFGIELSADRPQQVFIPEGFAHGFQALSDDVQLLYMHTQPWSPAHERTLRHDDPRIGIAWPLPVSQVSEKDRSAALLTPEFAGTTP